MKFEIVIVIVIVIEIVIEVVIEVEPALGIAAKRPQHVKHRATARTCSE